MKRTIALLALLIPMAVLSRPGSDEVLARAFERIDAGEARFSPYRFLYEVHSWVRGGDGELEEEVLERGRVNGFTPDSTETEVIEEKKIVGGRDESAKGKDGEGDGTSIEAGGGDEEGRPAQEGSGDASQLPQFDEAFRGRHEFRFDRWTEREGRPAAAFNIRPAKRKKDYWKGRVWIDPEDGSLLAVDLEPAKRPFGLRAMKLQAEYIDYEGRDLPSSMDMDIEVKVPLLVHKKIRIEMRFTDFTPLEK